MGISPALKWSLSIGGLLLGGLLVAAFSLQRLAVFPSAMTRGRETNGVGVAALEVLWLEIDGGRVEAWFLPGDGVDASNPGPVVIFAHGNAELIDLWPAQLEHYRRRGISVLLPEYRGYGRSGGSASEQAIVADYVAFYDLVAARPDVDAERMVLHGRSLGGGVVAGLARQRPAAAMVLQSTFTSIADLAWDKWFVPAVLIRDPFETLTAVREFAAPVLIVHGRQDKLIPVSHAEALSDAASDATLVLEDGGHNDVPRSWPEFWAHVDTLLAEAGVALR